MPALPWKSRALPEPEREYLVLASFLPLRTYRATFRFARAAAAVRRQLKNASGLVGYSLLARPFARKYYTLSAWRSGDDLQAFVETFPHVEVMSSLSDDMGTTHFERWIVKGSALPPKWSRALDRIGD
jgi:heme-degrading monooxygenase HmoA